ncbi:hypothetical protein DFH27DRAFT_641503 [Peziza echinospora]|nr:hypothetical protein DFH27DRAFT_641503 [Peziza echinospora]
MSSTLTTRRSVILPGGAPEPTPVHPLDQVNTHTLAILNRPYPSLIHAYRPPWHGHKGTFLGRRDPVTGTWSSHGPDRPTGVGDKDVGEGPNPTPTEDGDRRSAIEEEQAPTGAQDTGLRERAAYRYVNRTLRDPVIPEFCGEDDALIVKAWIARLELELLSHELPATRWTLAVLWRLALGSVAQQWASHMFGTGANTTAPDWQTFRWLFLERFGNPTEWLDAEAGWTNLHKVWTTDPVKNAVTFQNAMEQLQRARSEDEAAQESEVSLMWAYRSRLGGNLAIHIEKLVQDRMTLRRMIAPANSTTGVVTIKELLQATIIWACQTTGKIHPPLA